MSEAVNESERPCLRVVRGNPTDEELAALAAVVATLGTTPADSASADGEEQRRSTWAAPSRLVRRPLPHGPGAWRASALPG